MEMEVAWAEAEAAMPLAGWTASDGRWVVPAGDWHIVIEHLDSGDGYFEPYVEGYRASVYLGLAEPQSSLGRTVIGSIESSPATALLHLASALRALHGETK